MVSDCLAEINLVQKADDIIEGADTVFTAFDQTPTEGNLLIAIAGNRDGSAAPTTPTGWSVAISSPTGSPGQIIYYKIAGASEPDTVTVGPYPIDSRRGLHIYEYSGIDASDVVEAIDEATGSSINVSPGSVTTAEEALIIAGVTINAITSFSSWTNSFIERNDFINAGQPGSKSVYAGADLISVDAGTFSTTGTSDSSGSWIGQIVAFNTAINCACTVTTVADTGSGSLRECLELAQVCSGTTIEFDIPAPGNMSDGGDSWWRISPNSALPEIHSHSTVIDGTTQTTNRGNTNSLGPEIEINGDNAGATFGINILTADNAVKGLVVNGFNFLTYGGVRLAGTSATGNTIHGCYIGTNATGDSAVPNYYGLLLSVAVSDNEFGGPNAGEGNVISGNSHYGIYQTSGCDDNRYRGNFIGTNARCDTALGNGTGGFRDSGNSGTIIGGANPGEGNVISGNGANGFDIITADNVLIQGNRIGTDSSGTIKIPNGGDGIYFLNCDTITIGGTAEGAENIISGNLGKGLEIQGTDFVYIYGNMIGTGPVGDESGLDNEGLYNIGVLYNDPPPTIKIGGLDSGEGNIIANASLTGVYCNVDGRNIEIAGNVIRDNGEHGIQSISDSLNIIGNLIHGNLLDGVQLSMGTTDNFIYHNTVHGNGSDGIEVLDTSAVIAAIIKNNIISGSGGYGININAGSSSTTEAYNDITDAITNPPNVLGRSTDDLAASDRNADPMYIDTTSGDFTLTEPISPAINAGTDLGVDQPDMNGSDAGLYNGPAPDMGAYESGVEGADLVVSTDTDVVDGDTTSIATLLASKGADGEISLREAIVVCNRTSGANLIDFSIGSGVQTIQPTSALPSITDTIVIDCTSQPGFTQKPIIELDGSSAGSGASGLVLASGSSNSNIRGLVVNSFDEYGIHVNTVSDITIVNCYIGTHTSGTVGAGNGNDGVYLQSATDCIIGGTSSDDRNVISGNDNAGNNANGIRAEGGSGHTIRGNYIGIDANGTADLGNFNAGIMLDDCANNFIGGTEAGARNVITGNGNYGIFITGSADSNLVQGNYIGTDSTGTVELGNGGHGIAIETEDNTIGSDAANAGNIIANNTGYGITVRSGTGNSIRQNSIYGNTQLGIELGDDGVSSNDEDDGDSGANNLQNYPVLNSAIRDGADTIVISASLNSTASTDFIIEYFSDSAADPTGYGEGETYLGDTTVTTDGSGDVSFSTTLAAAVAVGAVISATATDPNGNTSEFADTVAATESSSLSVTVSNGTFAFGVIPANQWLTPDSSFVINDGSAAENFLGQISQFTDGGNTWDISATDNGADSIRAQWSTTANTGPWTDIATFATGFTIATDVAVADTVTVWFRIQTPVTTSSYSEYSSSFTVTAEAY